MCKRLFVLTLCAFVLSTMVAPVAQAGDPTLIAWWKLDDGSGTVALDSSGNEQHGTIENPDGGLGTGGSVWFDDPERGMVISFNGTDGSGACVDPDLILPAMTPDNDFTWIFWAKQHADQAIDNDTIMGNRYGGTASPLQFCKFTPTRFEAYNDDGSYLNGINYDAAPGDVWVHHAVVKAGAELTYYRDGVVALTNTMVKTLDENPFYMGADGFSGVVEAWEGYLSDVRLYTRALNASEVLGVMAGKGPNAQLAGNPTPEHEAIDVPRDGVLGWAPGEFAATHDVYFGMVLDDVDAADRANPLGVLLSQGQAGATYDPDGLLTLGQTYYWRVDEVNAAPDNTIFKGEVWSFTAEPSAYPVENIIATASSSHSEEMGPAQTVDGSGLNADNQHSTVGTDMWLSAGGAGLPAWIQYDFDRAYKLHEMQVWNSNQAIETFVGFGAKEVVVEYSVDGVEWTALEGASEFAQASGSITYAANTIVDFGGAMARSVKITINTNWGILPQAGLSEVRFMYIPTFAREPQPADGATDVSLDASLNWRLGREAAAHEVYFSTDEQAVLDGTALLDTVSEKGYTPTGLEYGQTYYWKINEVNDAAVPAVVEGDVWDFATIRYFAVDDMESYNDDLDAGTAIFQTWIDGWDNGTGSTVGYVTSPFAERTITNSGKQSMPLDYNNVNSPWYSETERTWDSPQNWTGDGVTHLTVNFRGNAVGFVETGPDSFTMGAAGADIWNNADEFRYAYKRLSGDGAIVAKVESIVQTDVWAKAGVMIRESLDPGSTHAMVVVTPASSVSFQRRLITSDVSSSTDAAAGLAAPYWVKITRSGNTFTAQRSEDGVTWLPMTADAAASSVTIEMIGNVYIGLAVTSHSAGNATTAEFSNVATTGTVTGAWQAAAIGAAQPANSPGQLYVALEDSAGKLKVVNHPDANATNATAWQEWNIPLGDFTGVNMAKVTRMIIGVGDRDNPSPDGSGLLYIDDIRVSNPAPAAPVE